jgi:hypothetical protein
MSHLDTAPAVAAERAAPSSSHSAQPGFTRAHFIKDGRVHTESRCHQCGFRIIAASSAGFDDEEQKHAGDCRGTQAE